MATRQIPCAASSLTSALLRRDDLSLPPRPAVPEVARTRMSVHYETGDASLPVLTLCLPGAVRLPNSVVTETLPAPGAPLGVSGGLLRAAGSTWRVSRWWRPARPRGLTPPADPARLPRGPFLDDEVPAPRPSYDGLQPAVLVGAGPGLTPTGDDVLAGALVTAHATADPRLDTWRRATRRALATRQTTVVSRALLHHALDGYATPELAGFLTVLCGDGDLAGPLARLLAVGHTSGAGLLTGVVHTLSTYEMRGAA